MQPRFTAMRSLALLAVGCCSAPALVLAAGSGVGGPCAEEWLPTFGQRPGTDGPVRAVGGFDDGSGPAVYVGASVAVAGAQGIARWDGNVWSALGAGVSGEVLAMATFDDGSGPALYVGGNLTAAGGATAAAIARWDGTSWSALGSGITGTVRTMAVHDDGSGAALYIAGTFTQAGGAPAENIARWNGAVWSTVGTGIQGTVNALRVHDDGTGAALYAGGAFTSAGGAPASLVARWDGLAWSDVGGGISASPGQVVALVEHGSDLVAGGNFSAGFPFSVVAGWDGIQWTNMGFPSGVMHSLESHGGLLYVGGRLTGEIGPTLRRWTGGTGWFTVWGQEASGMINVLASLDAGAGPELFLGLSFSDLYFVCGGYEAFQAHHIATYSGTFSALGSGPSAPILALETFGSGANESLYAGGLFRTADGACSLGIARWDGSGWVALGTALTNNFPGNDATVHALKAFNDGSGTQLYAGGKFLSGSGFGIARYDGATWSTIGNPATEVRTFEGFAPQGGGPRLYAGGVGGARISQWDGTSWSAVGAGVDGSVLALAVFDDGGGPALYAAGEFQTAGGAPASRIARWDGLVWTPLASGVNGTVRALTVHDDGSGPALFVGGDFTTAGGSPASRVARWDGAGWSALSTGVNGTVRALTSYAGVLHVGGDFTDAGGSGASRIARWAGSAWSGLGSGSDLAAGVNALQAWDAGSGSELFVGGSFAASPTGDGYLARWRGCEILGQAYCFGDGSGTLCPCGNHGAPGAGCANSTGAGAVLSASGSASVAQDDLVLWGVGLVPNNHGLAFVGNNAPGGGAGIPFGDGLRCAAGNVRRLGVSLADAQGQASWGPGLAALGAWQPGDLRRFQIWYRDPQGSPCGTGSNQTNGLEVLFE